MTSKITIHSQRYSPLAHLEKMEKPSSTLTKGPLEAFSQKENKPSFCHRCAEVIKRIFEKFLCILRCIFCCKCNFKNNEITEQTQSTSIQSATTTAAKLDVKKETTSKGQVKPVHSKTIAMSQKALKVEETKQSATKERTTNLAQQISITQPNSIKAQKTDLKKEREIPVIEKPVHSQTLPSQKPTKVEESKTIAKQTEPPAVEETNRNQIFGDFDKMYLPIKKIVRDYLDEPDSFILNYKDLSKVSYDELVKELERKEELAAGEIVLLAKKLKDLKEVISGQKEEGDGLKILFSLCKNLKEIRFKQPFDEEQFKQPFDIEHLKNLAIHFPHRVVANFRETILSDEELKAFIANCPHLYGIDLSLCRYISNEGLQAIAKNCKHLRVLNLSGCITISANGLKPIFNSCTQLEDVNLQDLVSIGSALKPLRDNCKKLRKLNFTHAIPDGGVQDLVENFKELEELHLAGDWLWGDITLQHIANNCDKLQKLYVNRNRERVPLGFTDTGLKALANCKQLKELRLVHCDKISDLAVQELVQKCDMEVLELPGCVNLTDWSLQAIEAFCPNLKRLSLRGCSQITNEGLLALIKSCHKLEELDVMDCNLLTDAVFKPLVENCKQLRKLFLPWTIGDASNKEFWQVLWGLLPKLEITFN